MMKRIGLAVLVAGAATGLAAAQTAPAPESATTDLNTGQVTIVYDQALTEEFEVSREIVDRIQAEFGEHAVYDNGQDLPEGVDEALAPGNALPDGVEVADAPEKLGDLPTLGEGNHWVAIGEHLVEVTPDNTIVMVVYDALP